MPFLASERLDAAIGGSMADMARAFTGPQR
jgi:hypothetical protein